MVTTIQVDEKTLLLLKRLKAEYAVASYEEAIKRLVMQRANKSQIGGSLAKYYKRKKLKDVLNELQKERREGDRF
ncbi:hypothetical protein J4217_03790 [Candidatus Pacearchaeota archaeon]|nr:hypothetical protein [uncultured archaeon]AQS33238.1 hypothetical protein [uncultured archaeon]MBS3091541.1 hypothetical protein [Candidatus Pacearchaeota archaeon]